MKTSTASLSLALLMLAPAAFAGDASIEDSNTVAAQQASIEPILGYLPTKTGIVFQVKSGGCTKAHDFVSRIARDENTKIASVVLARMRPDNCFPFIPMGERFTLTYQQLGIKPGEHFIIKNPNGVVQSTLWSNGDL